MSPEEELAYRLLSASGRYASVLFSSDQSQGSADFVLLFDDGRRGVAEVSRIIDTQHMRTAGALEKMARKDAVGVAKVAKRKCQDDWLVFPSKTANIRRLVEALDERLAPIEARGVDPFFGQDWEPGNEVDALVRLGVEYATRVRWKSPGLLITHPSFEGLITVEPLANEVRRIVALPDNQRKLAQGGDERHMMIYVDSRTDVAWKVINDLEPPADFPTPPPPATRVTLYAGTRSSGEVVSWSWDAESSAWRRELHPGMRVPPAA